MKKLTWAILILVTLCLLPKDRCSPDQRPPIDDPKKPWYDQR